MNSYQPPDITGHEEALKAVLHDFLVQCEVPDLHEAVVYTMQHLPPGVPRVDGTVIQPLLRQVRAEMLLPVVALEIVLAAGTDIARLVTPPLASPPPASPSKLQTLKTLWKKIWK